jgi:hypothetical protein
MVKEVRVSETMRPSISEGMQPVGLWEAETGRVIVHRSQLQTVGAFAGTLLHEFSRASTGLKDISREFEGDDTDWDRRQGGGVRPRDTRVPMLGAIAGRRDSGGYYIATSQIRPAQRLVPPSPSTFPRSGEVQNGTDSEHQPEPILRTPPRPSKR